MKKRNNSDIYRIVLNFLLPVLLSVCVAVLISGTQFAGDKAAYQLNGSRYERIYFEDIKNSCINLFSMVK